MGDHLPTHPPTHGLVQKFWVVSCLTLRARLLVMLIIHLTDTYLNNMFEGDQIMIKLCGKGGLKKDKEEVSSVGHHSRVTNCLGQSLREER